VPRIPFAVIQGPIPLINLPIPKGTQYSLYRPYSRYHILAELDNRQGSPRPLIKEVLGEKQIPRLADRVKERMSIDGKRLIRKQQFAGVLERPFRLIRHSHTHLAVAGIIQIKLAAILDNLRRPVIFHDRLGYWLQRPADMSPCREVLGTQYRKLPAVQPRPRTISIINALGLHHLRVGQISIPDRIVIGQFSGAAMTSARHAKHRREHKTCNLHLTSLPLEFVKSFQNVISRQTITSLESRFKLKNQRGNQDMKQGVSVCK